MKLVERITLFPVLVGETWRRVRLRWKASAYSGLSLPTAALPVQTCAPVDFRPADADQATYYYRGHYAFGDHVLELQGDTPFAAKPPHSDWETELHSFRWLRHLSAANTDLAKAQGAAFIADWMRLCDRSSAPQAFEPSVLADRLIAWTCHAPLLMKNAGPDRRSEMRRSMAQQARLLQSLQSILPIDAPRLKCVVALTYVALCFGAREKYLRASQRDLTREIDRQILADGGHISRNPAVLVDLLADIWPLLDAYSRAGKTPDEALISAVDRMIGALRFFRHCDGTLAQFNGTGVPSSALLAKLLDEAPASSHSAAAQVQQSAPFTGYERLNNGSTVLIMDTGAPLTRASAANAAAGCLAFELSSGKNRFIINVGKPIVDAKRYAPFWRVTGAHSTASINADSSSRFARNARLANALPAPMTAWPQKVTRERRVIDTMHEIDASHDGYAEDHGLVHRRIVQLSKNGKVLNGADRFERIDPHMTLDDTQQLVLRFHLSPSISASLLANGHSILLAAPDRETWTFTCVDAPIALEESVHFAEIGGPRKTEQIVVRAPSNRHGEIRWSLERKQRRASPRAKAKTEELPDLLSSLDYTIEQPEPAE